MSHDTPERFAVSALGHLLREWRHARGLSQLELALAAGISARHLSFVETGRAQPGRDVVLRLASALDLPLRDRNAALTAAGYAPLYRHARLDAPEMAPVVRAIDFMLRQQEPYPAMVLERLGNIHRLNRAASRFLRLLLGERAPAAGQPVNLFRLLLQPDGLRPHIVNGDDVARVVALRLRGEVASLPGDQDARAFLEAMLSQPGLPADCRNAQPDASTLPVVPTEFRAGERVLRLFNTITTLGTPQDVTLQELRIECSFPADAETDAALKAFAAADPESDGRGGSNG